MALDREDIPSYLLTVMATDNGTPSRNSTATISVTIIVGLTLVFTDHNCMFAFYSAQDVNDEEPIFSPAFRNTSIDEDSREGTPVLRITAMDADTLPNAMLRYSLSVAGETAEASLYLTVDEFPKFHRPI